MNKLLSLEWPGEGGGGYGDITGITNPVLDEKLQRMDGVKFFQTLLPNLLTLALIIGSIIFVFIIIIGAIQWITSGGEKQSLENARGKIKNALVGLVVLFVIFAIVKFIEYFLGIDILALDIGPLLIK